MLLAFGSSECFKGTSFFTLRFHALFLTGNGIGYKQSKTVVGPIASANRGT